MTAVTRSTFAADIAVPQYIFEKVPRSRQHFGVSAPFHLYYYRAYDTGTAGFVDWGPYADPVIGLNPSASQTTPNYTGTLQHQHVWLVK